MEKINQILKKLIVPLLLLIIMEFKISDIMTKDTLKVVLQNQRENL